jgi:hypothetical protein
MGPNYSEDILCTTRYGIGQVYTMSMYSICLDYPVFSLSAVIWILATYNGVGHLLYRRYATTTLYVTPTMSYIISYVRYRMCYIREVNLRHRKYYIVGFVDIVGLPTT